MGHMNLPKDAGAKYASKLTNSIRRSARHIFPCDRQNPKKEVRKAFHRGSNSSCRQHIRQHYERYKDGCEALGISLSNWCIPRQIWNDMQSQAAKASKKQTTLDNMLVKTPSRAEFTKEAVLEAVTRFVVCDDQVSFSTMAMGLGKLTMFPGHSRSHSPASHCSRTVWLR